VVVLATLGGLMTGMMVALFRASSFFRDVAKQTAPSTDENKKMLDGSGKIAKPFTG
jgi:hypothetical protein